MSVECDFCLKEAVFMPLFMYAVGQVLEQLSK